jgi:hypothetical protein
MVFSFPGASENSQAMYAFGKTETNRFRKIVRFLATIAHQTGSILFLQRKRYGIHVADNPCGLTVSKGDNSSVGTNKYLRIME